MAGVYINGDSGRIREDLEPWVRRIIRETVQEHQIECKLQDRVAQLELRFSALLAFMAGSGLLGGAAGVLLSEALRL